MTWHGWCIATILASSGWFAWLGYRLAKHRFEALPPEYSPNHDRNRCQSCGREQR